MVLGVLVAGGNLMANQTLTAGDLMSFLVSTQTIQKWDVYHVLIYLHDRLDGDLYMRFTTKDCTMYMYLKYNVIGSFILIRKLIVITLYKS